jgi:hypothetical protein
MSNASLPAHTRIVTIHHTLARWFRCRDCPNAAPRERVAEIAPQELGTVEAIVGDDVIVKMDKYPECPVLLPRRIVRAVNFEGGQTMVEWIVIIAVFVLLVLSIGFMLNQILGGPR